MGYRLGGMDGASTGCKGLRLVCPRYDAVAAELVDEAVGGGGPRFAGDVGDSADGGEPVAAAAAAAAAACCSCSRRRYLEGYS